MLHDAHVKEMAKTSTVAFMKARNSLVVRCREKRNNMDKTEDGENIFLKALANRFRLTSKIIRCAKEQQSCLWQTFC